MAALCSFLKKWYWEGVLTPPPVCLYAPPFFKVFSDNPCCKIMGKIGFRSLEKYRAPIMFWAFVSSFIGTILLCVSCASVSYSGGVIKNTPWSVGSFSVNNADADYKIFLGLNVYVGTCDGDDCRDSQTTERWSSNDCDQLNGNSIDDDEFSDFCDSCKTASAGTVSTAIMSLITNIPQMTTDVQRSIASGDVHCQKTMGMVTGIIGTLTTLAAISEWKAGCFDDAPSQIDGSDVTWRLSVSLICMILATLLKVFDTICHVLVPMPREGYWEPPPWSGGKKRDQSENALEEVLHGKSPVHENS